MLTYRQQNVSEIVREMKNIYRQRRQIYMHKVLKKEGGGKWRRGAFWVKKVSCEEYEAAAVNTAKFEEICARM